MVYGYIRVSTEKQTVENQRYEIQRYCAKKGMQIDGWIEEIVTGTKTPDKRKLGLLLKHIRKDDIIVCAELSRLGRSLYMIFDILSICMEKGCKVWTIKDNFQLGDDIQSKVLAFAFGLSAEIERNLISQRTKEALELRRKNGVQLGRREGSLGKCTKLTPYHDTIKLLIDKGNTYADIAKMLKVDRATVKRYCDSRGLQRQDLVIRKKQREEDERRKREEFLKQDIEITPAEPINLDEVPDDIINEVLEQMEAEAEELEELDD